jgi:predicted transcriptional regulator
MAKKFSELEAKMSPEAREWVKSEVAKTLADMPLNELRNARGLSQQMLAEALHIQQPAIAKLEKRTDMYISTLRSHIKAMGGELEVIARFPDGDVRISNFSQI